MSFSNFLQRADGDDLELLGPTRVAQILAPFVIRPGPGGAVISSVTR